MFFVGSHTFIFFDDDGDNLFNTDVPAQIIDEMPMLPVRALMESIGAFVDWDGSTRTVFISHLYPISESEAFPSESANQLPATHIVAAGETLFSIASLYFENPDMEIINRILEHNNMTSDELLMVGQQIIIPAIVSTEENHTSTQEPNEAPTIVGSWGASDYEYIIHFFGDGTGSLIEHHENALIEEEFSWSTQNGSLTMTFHIIIDDIFSITYIEETPHSRAFEMLFFMPEAPLAISAFLNPQWRREIGNTGDGLVGFWVPTIGDGLTGNSIIFRSDGTGAALYHGVRRADFTWEENDNRLQIFAEETVTLRYSVTHSSLTLIDDEWDVSVLTRIK
jgi:LysM repeat protein